MELWDVYDRDRVKTGRTMVRGEPICEGDYHLVIHVCIFDGNGKMLIQKRQTTKKAWPDMWDVSVGGSAVAGDTSRMAAKRETAEELGLKLDFDEAVPVMTVYDEGCFDDIYIVHCEPDISSLHLQEEEVQAVKWAGLDEILAMKDRGEFVPWRRGLIESFFETAVCRGSINR